MKDFVDEKMESKNIIGKRIEQIIFAKGFNSVRSFAKYMKNEYPSDYVTEDTIGNAIKGKNIRNSTLTTIAKALGINKELLISENIPMLDKYMGESIEPLIEERNRLRKEKNQYKHISKYYPEENIDFMREELESEMETLDRNFQMVDRYQELKNKFDIETSSYPLLISESGLKCSTYPILTVPELLLYMPICDMQVCTDILYRIAGSITDYEEYIFQQIRYLYKCIPDIPAKRYVDCQVQLSRLRKKEILNNEEARLQKKLNEYRKTKDYDEGYWQYRGILETKNKYRGWMYDLNTINR